MNEEEKKKKMTVEEVGRKGGETTAQTHGREFYEEIGKKGGEERAREIREEGISPETHEKLVEAGRKGGEARAREIQEEGISMETHEKLVEAGHKGGEATARTHGKEFYQEIGKRGGETRAGVERIVREPERMKRHLREDIDFPANKEQLLVACNEMSDLEDGDREWFAMHLPDRTYNNADEVMEALGLEEE